MKKVFSLICLMFMLTFTTQSFASDVDKDVTKYEKIEKVDSLAVTIDTPESIIPLTINRNSMTSYFISKPAVKKSVVAFRDVTLCQHTINGTRYTITFAFGTYWYFVTTSQGTTSEQFSSGFLANQRCNLLRMLDEDAPE